MHIYQSYSPFLTTEHDARCFFGIFMPVTVTPCWYMRREISVDTQKLWYMNNRSAPTLCTGASRLSKIDAISSQDCVS